MEKQNIWNTNYLAEHVLKCGTPIIRASDANNLECKRQNMSLSIIRSPQSVLHWSFCSTHFFITPLPMLAGKTHTKIRNNGITLTSAMTTQVAKQQKSLRMLASLAEFKPYKTGIYNALQGKRMWVLCNSQ